MNWSQRHGTRRVTWELRLTRWALVLFLAALAVAARHVEAWPAANWAVYSTKVPGVPASTVSVMELRVEGPTGTWQVIPRTDLFQLDRMKVLDRVITAALGADAGSAAKNQRYITTLVSQVRPHLSVRKIEAWELTWQVDPLASPPLRLGDPTTQRLLGGFAPVSRGTR